MPQEFLASFAVDIDESGVNRLQVILDQNRELAEKVSAAFDQARASMDHYLEGISQDDLSGLVSFLNASSGRGSQSPAVAPAANLNARDAVKKRCWMNCRSATVQNAVMRSIPCCCPLLPREPGTLPISGIFRNAPITACL